MNNLLARRTTWDADADDDNTPLLQRWARSSIRKAVEIIHDLLQCTLSAAYKFSRNPTQTTRASLVSTTRNLFTIPGILITIWIIALYKGEHGMFDASISACDWASWERWPEHAYPHRLAFVSDPQLVDPHTYPGRPWPLSTLTVKHTDLYMKRAFSRIQRKLYPDTIIFLGDLFDGGREWSTESSKSPEERYRQYGENFWQKEYRRFSSIFLRDWREVLGSPHAGSKQEPTTRIIASLPGNHDLGFGQNIQLPVRERFNAFFGESNRIDLIGNHTFVSLDTVSLSAMDSDQSDPQIWTPTYEFLVNSKTSVDKTIGNHLRYVREGLPRSSKFAYGVADLSDSVEERISKRSSEYEFVDFPTILLTHVPLNRPLGKPCGPLRERWPPTSPPPGQTEPVEPDERNSIPAQGYGWQYQNVLSTRVSKLIVDSLGGTITRAFSGDDHDYCDVVHEAYLSPGRGIREITVKSISWAMGVRKPGFVLASLWNEIDSNGKKISRDIDAHSDTLQTHLCLIPDQISILMHYGILVGLSLILLAFRATRIIFRLQNGTPGLRDEDSRLMLPSTTSTAESEKLNDYAYKPHYHDSQPRNASSSSSDDVPLASLIARNTTAKRPRSVSPLPMYGYAGRPVQHQPLVTYANNRQGWKDVDASDDFKWGAVRSKSKRRKKRFIDRPLPIQFGILLGEGVWMVCRVVFVWYGWLLYT